MKYIGKKGIELIKRFDGFKAKPYLCSAGVWTIGYGHTNGVTKDSRPVSREDAEGLLREDLMAVVDGLNRLVPESLTQEQFDSLCSFCYNLGVPAFQNSTLRKVIDRNQNDHARIRTEFMRWVYVKGRSSDGLIRRREEEADLYCGRVTE